MAYKYRFVTRFIEGTVFFKDKESAVNAGYRPCGICRHEEYLVWKQQQKEKGIT